MQINAENVNITSVVTMIQRTFACHTPDFQFYHHHSEMYQIFYEFFTCRDRRAPIHNYVL